MNWKTIVVGLALFAAGVFFLAGILVGLLLYWGVLVV